MRRALPWGILGLLLAALLGWGMVLWSKRDLETVETTGYFLCPSPGEVLVDDRLEDKTPTFDPSLVHRRALDDWQVNLSAAVIKLDMGGIRPDGEDGLRVLYPSYKEAAEVARRKFWHGFLPSVNLIDGKAKQFDDGLYAALDAAYYRGLDDRLQSHVQFVKRLYDKVGKDSVAAPFLAAGLGLAGVKVAAADSQGQADWSRQFLADEVASKPIGFYTWNRTLFDCFRFLRFFQHEFPLDKLAIPRALAETLAQDGALLADYRKALDFYAKLTNPAICFSVADLVGMPAAAAGELGKLAAARQITHRAVALFPPSTSRETVLFEKLFPRGLPENANLMNELIGRIRSGQVDLKPRPGAGWYDYQVYALETLLLPEQGTARGKLLLTWAYKKRLLEAFHASLTKRRETHVRQVVSATKSARPVRERQLPDRVKPRVRLEPCPSYYLRTARAYAFLANFLEAAIGKEALASLHGLRQGGEREQDLGHELVWMRELFYGLYLLTAEDIGLKPALAADEPVDQERCYGLAEDWLGNVLDDPDLAADTRVAVPIAGDPNRQVVRLWATLGVRLAKLDVAYARPPYIKPLDGSADWKVLDMSRTAPAHFLIPVDEFAEVEQSGWRTLTRDELRAICDREKTREAIIAALKAKH